MYTMAHRLAELHVKKSADTLCDVKAFAPVDVLAYTPEWKKKKKKEKKHMPRHLK